jgi:acyl carrier protein
VAYVVPQDGEGPGAGELRKGLRAALPDYMVPSVFVLLDALPLTPNGKVDRKALPAPEALPKEAAIIARPRTETELRIGRLWSELLGVATVGRTDNFFDLGGHSLLAMRMIHRLEAEVGVQLSPREVLFRTLEQIAAICDEKTASRSPAVVERPRGWLHRLRWWVRRLVPGVETPADAEKLASGSPERMIGG